MKFAEKLLENEGKNIDSNSLLNSEEERMLIPSVTDRESDRKEASSQLIERYANEKQVKTVDPDGLILI